MGMKSRASRARHTKWWLPAPALARRPANARVPPHPSASLGRVAARSQVGRVLVVVKVVKNDHGGWEVTVRVRVARGGGTPGGTAGATKLEVECVRCVPAGLC